MIGASRFFMMRSKPRWNGSNCPMRVIWPSAKMQTTSPLRMASLAVCSAWISSRGRCSDETGMARENFGERLDPAAFVNALEHQETDGPVGGGDEQQRVGEGQMIADEQRAAFGRDIVAPDDADSVDRCSSRTTARTAAARRAASNKT